MTEERELTKAEFYQLLATAPEEEADNLIAYCRQIGSYPWDFFQQFSLGTYGILFAGEPVYFACLYDLGDDTYRLWTIRKKDIKEQFTLFKLCKRKIAETAKRWNPIFATNYVKNKLEAKWNMRLGFIPYKIEGDLVHYRLDNHKGGV